MSSKTDQFKCPPRKGRIQPGRIQRSPSKGRAGSLSFPGDAQRPVSKASMPERGWYLSSTPSSHRGAASLAQGEKMSLKRPFKKAKHLLSTSMAHAQREFLGLTATLRLAGFACKHKPTMSRWGATKCLGRILLPGFHRTKSNGNQPGIGIPPNWAYC